MLTIVMFENTANLSFEYQIGEQVHTSLPTTSQYIAAQERN